MGDEPCKVTWGIVRDEVQERPNRFGKGVGMARRPDKNMVILIQLRRGNLISFFQEWRGAGGGFFMDCPGYLFCIACLGEVCDQYLHSRSAMQRVSWRMYPRISSGTSYSKEEYIFSFKSKFMVGSAPPWETARHTRKRGLPFMVFIPAAVSRAGME